MPIKYVSQDNLTRVLSKLKTLIGTKADATHDHAAGDIKSGTLSSDRLPIVPISKGGTGAATAEEARKSLAITPENIGAASASAVSAKYNESIIGLSVDGQTVTYIKGDGSVHSFQTQDTDTTYSIGTDQATGLTKLYATTGSAEDGTMTQKAIKTELDKKVGVEVDTTQNALIFKI